MAAPVGSVVGQGAAQQPREEAPGVGHGLAPELLGTLAGQGVEVGFVVRCGEHGKLL
jgi:hypothetical protein